jgi:hypothetical protein
MLPMKTLVGSVGARIECPVINSFLDVSSTEEP